MVQAYMDLVSLSGSLIAGGEPPDFVIQSQTGAIAVEVLEYHLPHRTAAGHTRREVESSWQALRDFVVEYRQKYPELDRLHVVLEFAGLLVPRKSELAAFVDAVRCLIMPTVKAARVAGDQGRKKVKVGDGQPTILRRYLTAVEVRLCQAYLEWDWNHEFARVGTSDDEMADVLSRKIATYRPVDGIAQNVLIVGGWRGLLSEVIAPMGAWQFAGFTRLNAMLASGPFDQVAILCTRDLLWERGAGWRDLKRNDTDK